MIPNDALINALRSLNYSFKKQTDRVDLYRKKGSTQLATVRRNKLHDESYARTVLKLAGMSAADIEAFCNSARK